MKTFITSLIIVFASVFIAGCFTRPEASVKVVVLKDVTDHFNSQPKSEEILKFYDFSSKGLWEAKQFQYSVLSDVSRNYRKEIVIEGESQLIGNELQRKKEIASFKEGISSTLTAASNDTTGRTRSSIYFPLTEALQHLSASGFSNKTLVLYSDLMENGPALSFYDDATYAMLKDDPASVERKLVEKAPLPGLQGIVIYIIYLPVSSEDDETFTVVSSFYKHLLEKRGATVYIQANL